MMAAQWRALYRRLHVCMCVSARTHPRVRVHVCIRVFAHVHVCAHVCVRGRSQVSVRALICVPSYFLMNVFPQHMLVAKV